MDYLHEQHTVHLIVYHIIWCPKRRRRILRGEIAQRLEQLVNEVAVEHNWQVLNLSIQPDHVHLFIRSNPYTLPTDIALPATYAVLVDTFHILLDGRECE
jgi:putative transposase